MRTLIAMTALLATTSGCIVYEHSGSDCDEDWTCGDWDLDDNGLLDSGEEQAPAVELAFAPDHAEQGEVFPAIITRTEGELDLTSVSEIQVFGDATVLSAVHTADRITLILEVPAEAELGAVDVVLTTQDGDGELIPEAFTIFEAGSGNSGTDWTGEDGTGGSAGEGSGSGDGDCE
jgi:hypothetical protein